MFLAGVDFCKTAYFIKAQSFWQRVTKLIPCDDVTRFDILGWGLQQQHSRCVFCNNRTQQAADCINSIQN